LGCETRAKPFDEKKYYLATIKILAHDEVTILGCRELNWPNGINRPNATNDGSRLDLNFKYVEKFELRKCGKPDFEKINSEI